jgi:hypothetical protein
MVNSGRRPHFCWNLSMMSSSSHSQSCDTCEWAERHGQASGMLPGLRKRETVEAVGLGHPHPTPLASDRAPTPAERRAPPPLRCPSPLGSPPAPTRRWCCPAPADRLSASAAALADLRAWAPAPWACCSRGSGSCRPLCSLLPAAALPLGQDGALPCSLAQDRSATTKASLRTRRPATRGCSLSALLLPVPVAPPPRSCGVGGSFV